MLCYSCCSPRKLKPKPFQPIRRSTRISGNANGRTVSQIVPNTPAKSVAVTVSIIRMIIVYSSL